MPSNITPEGYIPASTAATSAGPTVQKTCQHPWSMTANATPEGFISPLDNQVPMMVNTPTVIHTRPQVEE